MQERQPGPPSQQVSTMRWRLPHCSLARTSISRPPQTGQAGRGILPSQAMVPVVSPCSENAFALAAIVSFIGDPEVTLSERSETGLQRA